MEIDRNIFLGSATGNYTRGDWVILGAPLDATTTYRQGADGGPAAIRAASDGLEEYCPVSDRSLDDVIVVDIGDIPLNVVPFPKNLDFIRNAVSRVAAKGARPLLLGGEHTVSLPAFEAMLEVHEDLCLIQFDAHADLREDYEGEMFSHACVVKRISDLIGPRRLHQIGIRSGTREEWGFMKEHKTLYPPRAEAMEAIANRLGDRPVYLTIDVDVLDPSVMPGTGTPEPGGMSYQVLDRLLRLLASVHVVAADVVELAPDLDPSGVSSVTASKIVRTMLLSL